jgi:hypothetical protein
MQVDPDEFFTVLCRKISHPQVLSGRDNDQLGWLGKVANRLVLGRDGRDIVVKESAELFVGACAAGEFDMPTVLNLG